MKNELNPIQFFIIVALSFLGLAAIGEMIASDVDTIKIDRIIEDSERI